MYYGTCGHGKGLVDAMSGFCVKIIITKDFSCKSAAEIARYLTYLLKKDHKQHNFLFFKDEISLKRSEKSLLKVPDCKK